jgi:alkylation response protein AidB-like acyl-CoA dehydrogenase
MRVYVDAELQEWRDAVRGVVEEFGVSYFRGCYQDRQFPHELYDTLADRGWLGLTVPEADGGQGAGHVEAAVLLEELGRYGYDFGVPAVTSLTVAENLVAYGTQAQRERFLPKLFAGELRFSVGITEPETGSDAAGLSTQAVREGDEYVVNGQKTYQSGAHAPNTVVHAYVRTDPNAEKREGVSAVLIPNWLDGVHTEELPLVSRKAAGTAALTFDGVRVPVANRVGAENEGWEILTDHLIREHLGMAATMVGNAATVVDRATEEATDRERFGRPIGEFQAIGHRLADMQTEVEAARGLVYRAASAIDRNEGSRRLAAQAKLKAGETLKTVASDGMQVLGGASLFPENDMQRYWRESVSATIAGGTSEIQRSIISRDMRSGQH